MQSSQQDQRVLRAMAEVRKTQDDLALLLDFYHDLYVVRFSAKAALPEPQLRPEADMRRCLADGIPQLQFDHLGVRPQPLRGLVAQVLDVLIEHNPGWKADLAGWTDEQLVARARRLFASPNLNSEEQARTAEGAPGADPDPIPIAVGLALAAFLQRAAECVVPHLDLSHWNRPRCPICGGTPDLALLEATAGARLLVCSRCDSQWSFSRVGCPFCNSSSKQTYFRSTDGLYRMYVCPDCRRYLKTVDLREAHRDILPAVERLLLVRMDLAAHTEGLTT